jgi:glycosyltransferase involved in cell wall biosynthesis
MVVVNSLWNYATRMARLSLVGSGVPYVVYPHGMLDPWFRGRYPLKHAAKQLLWWFNEGVLLRHADRVLFTCEEERLLARTTFFPYRVNEHVIAYGAGFPPPAAPGDAAAFRSMLPALGDRRYLLFLSRIHEKKGCDLLIEAFARQADRDPGLDLVIAGPDQTGLRSRLEQSARRLGVADRIHWPGMVSGAAKYGALRGAEAFILPSHQENFGIAVAEALACGCLVLISNQVNIWREIEAANAGFVANDDLAGTESLLSRFHECDSRDRQTMRRNAERIFAERFNMERGAMELVAIIREICQNRK